MHPHPLYIFKEMTLATSSILDSLATVYTWSNSMLRYTMTSNSAWFRKL